jgi:hypothetical protein
MNRRRRLLLAAVVLVATTACTADVSPTPTPVAPATPTATASPTATTSPTLAPTAGAPATSPTPAPEPPLSLPLPEGSDRRVVAASIAANVPAEGGTLTITVTSAATERIDEIVLRWPAGLEGTLRLAPFVPSEERVNDNAPPLRQEWTKWVVGPGEQGEPAGTISLGWGPLLPGATLVIELIATRIAEGPVAFDLQLLAGNDLLTVDGGGPAELRVEVP